MSFKFFTARLPGSSKYTSCTSLNGPEDVVNLDDVIFRGESLAAHWPEAAHTRTSKVLKGAELADAVDWYEPLLLCSPELANALAELLGDHIESHPIRVLHDGSGEVLDEDYRAVHVRAIHAAVDFEASDIKFSSADPTRILRFRKCVLHEDDVPSDCLVFRLAEEPSRILVHDEIAKALDGYVGLEFVPPSEFTR